jgi:acetolactate synthase-1/2/3 large subunit
MSGFWGTSLVNDMCLEADVILAVGARFKEADSSSWYRDYTFSIPPTELLHIDIEPSEISRVFPAEIGAVADARAALQVLDRVARQRFPGGVDRPDVRQRIARFRASFAADSEAVATSDAFPMMPERILADVRAVLPDDAYLTTDVGWNKNGVGQRFPIRTPGTFLTPGGFATMGFGPSAAIGAKLAAPDRTVVSLVGDGGFGQNPALLATAVEHSLAIVWVIMNNNAYGTIAGLQQAHFGSTYGTTFPGDLGDPELLPSYAAIADAYGATGIRVEAAADFRPALTKAIAMASPVVIDVAMRNNPTPTTGHWNILDIYSPGEQRSHVAT